MPKKDIYKFIGNQIKKARRKRNIEQRVLAEILDCTPAAISQYEKGKRRILLDDLVKVANALGYPLELFVGIKSSSNKKYYIPKTGYKNINKVKIIEQKLKELENKIKELTNKNQKLILCIVNQEQVFKETMNSYNELRSFDAHKNVHRGGGG